jgi:hypothetical protein
MLAGLVEAGPATGGNDTGYIFSSQVSGLGFLVFALAFSSTSHWPSGLWALLWRPCRAP